MLGALTPLALTLSAPAQAAVNPADYDFSRAEVWDTSWHWDGGAVLMGAPTAFRMIGARNDYFSGEHGYGDWQVYVGLPSTLQAPIFAWAGAGGGLTTNFAGPLNADLNRQVGGGAVAGDPNSAFSLVVGVIPSVGFGISLGGGWRLALNGGYLVSMVNSQNNGLIFTAGLAHRKTTLIVPAPTY